MDRSFALGKPSVKSRQSLFAKEAHSCKELGKSRLLSHGQTTSGRQMATA